MNVDERRAQLLALGIRAFGEGPYDEVSTEAIAAAAGISHGLLFHYFPTKHAFYVAVLRVAADQLVEMTFARRDGAPEERLLAGLDAYFRFVDGHAQTYATLLRAGVGSDEIVRALVDETRGAFIATIRRELSPFMRTAADESRVRAGLRGWIGLVEALALDWIDHRDLSRDELVGMALGALRIVPHVDEAFAARR